MVTVAIRNRFMGLVCPRLAEQILVMRILHVFGLAITVDLIWQPLR